MRTYLDHNQSTIAVLNDSKAWHVDRPGLVFSEASFPRKRESSLEGCRMAIALLINLKNGPKVNPSEI